MLLVILTLNILIFALLLMWICAMVQQVAIIRADVEFTAMLVRHKVAKELVDKGIKSKDIPLTLEEMDKFLQEVYK